MRILVKIVKFIGYCCMRVSCKHSACHEVKLVAVHPHPLGGLAAVESSYEVCDKCGKRFNLRQKVVGMGTSVVHQFEIKI